MEEFAVAQAMKHELFGVAVSELIRVCYLHDEDAFQSLCRTHFDSHVNDDGDNSGYLDQWAFSDSVRAVFHELGEEEPPLEKVARLFAEADTDGNGRIGFDEYTAAARRKLQGRIEGGKV